MAKYRFEQIAINSKEKKKPAEEDRFTYIGLEHLDTGSLNVTRFGSDVAPIGEKLVMRKGDVLFGKRRAYQKKVAIAPFDGIFSAHGMVLRPQEKVVDRKFFPLFISSDYFLDAAIKISVGSLSPTINWRDLKDLEFELPDLDTQKELAEVLWAINDTIESYKKLISVTDELVKSQFIEITQSGDRTPTRMGDIATYVNGYAFKPQDWSFEGVPIIRIQNLNDPSADFNRFAGEIDEKYLVHNGDVLVSWATHLEAYLWNGGDAWLNQHIFKVVFDKRKVNKVFFNFAANYALKEAFKKAHGFKATMEHIKRGDFEDAIVMMPDLFQQEEFATLVRQSDKSKFAVLNCLKRNLLLILQKTEDVHSLINQSAKKYFCKSCHRENHNG